jgi:predicted dehydrogenase
MNRNSEIGIGVIGAGFIAETRARCYAKAGGIRGRVVAVADTDEERGRSYADQFSVAKCLTDAQELLALPEVDMVDLCVPNHLHRPMTEMAAEAGKHIICTKPLTAYVGQDLPSSASDDEIAGRERRDMLALVVEDAQAMVAAAEKAGVLLMYGENWVFSPSIAKAAELAAAAAGTIVEMRGGECHSGSHSPFSKLWRYTGGGALLRLGAHPVGSMIYLKRLEGLGSDGKAIRPVSVSAEVGDLSKIPSVEREDKEWFARGWQGVENWGSALLTFDDGSRGIVWASDTMLGGMESKLEIFMSNCRMICNLSPNNLVEAFAPDPGVFSGAYLIEKMETKAGWSTPMPDEDWTSGHQLMCQSFVSSVAEGTPAPSDGQLGLDVVKAIYSAYVSAAEGKRVELT